MGESPSLGNFGRKEELRKKGRKRGKREGSGKKRGKEKMENGEGKEGKIVKGMKVSRGSFLFCLSLFETLKFVWGVPKMEILSGSVLTSPI